MDSALRLLGIARKAGRVEVGEEPAGAACRARQAKLLLVAADAADNSVRRAAHFAEAGKVPWLKAPWDKGTMGAAVGRSACAMLALTDTGLAAALAEKLAQAHPEAAAAAEELSGKAARALQRQKEQRAHEKKLERMGRKPWAAPPKPGGQKKAPAAKQRTKTP